MRDSFDLSGLEQEYKVSVKDIRINTSKGVLYMDEIFNIYPIRRTYESFHKEEKRCYSKRKTNI